MHDPVPPLPPGTPGPVADLVMAMLDKDPAGRPAGVGEFARELSGLPPDAASAARTRAMRDAAALTTLDSSGAGFAETRVDYPAGPAGDYGDYADDPERTRGDGRRLRHPVLLAAGTGVALACLAGAIAAFVLPGSPGPHGAPAPRVTASSSAPPPTPSSAVRTSTSPPAGTSPGGTVPDHTLGPGAGHGNGHHQGKGHEKSPGPAGSPAPTRTSPGQGSPQPTQTHTSPQPGPTTSSPAPTKSAGQGKKT
jgi:serine/threonine-protein kinase